MGFIKAKDSLCSLYKRARASTKWAIRNTTLNAEEVPHATHALLIYFCCEECDAPMSRTKPGDLKTTELKLNP